MTAEELRAYLTRAIAIVRIARNKLYKIANATPKEDANYLAANVAYITASNVAGILGFIRDKLTDETDAKKTCAIIHQHLELVGALIFDIWQSSSIADSKEIYLGVTVHVLYIIMAEIAGEFREKDD